MLTVSLGAVLAFIGLLALIYSLFYVKRDTKSLLFLLGLGLALIGLGAFLGIEITLSFKPSETVSGVVALIGVALIALGFYRKDRGFLSLRKETYA